MLDWLVIGGGVHGTFLSLFLCERLRARRDRVRVLDPHEVPLHAFAARARVCGAEFLRSPAGHHVDLEAGSLVAFAAGARRPLRASFRGPHRRPAFSLFLDHAAAVVHRRALADLRLRGEATGLRRRRGGFRVETREGALDARRVVLALGPGERAEWPQWARRLRTRGADVAHVFSRDFELCRPRTLETAVVGGGISGVEIALALAAEQPGKVALLVRHPLRVHSFDGDSTWARPRRLTALAGIAEPDRRRAAIRRGQNRGSVPSDLAFALHAAARQGRLRVVRGEVAGATLAGAAVALDLGAGAPRLHAERVVLATGFAAARPGGAWLETAVEQLGLPTASCGFPILDPALRWGDGIHVTGALAELALGPFARNIVGARLAAQRIALTS